MSTTIAERLQGIYNANAALISQANEAISTPASTLFGAVGAMVSDINAYQSACIGIKSAIEEKGVDMTNVSFPEFAQKIGEIPTGGGELVEERDFLTDYFNGELAYIEDDSILSFNSLQAKYGMLNKCRWAHCTKVTSITGTAYSQAVASHFTSNYFLTSVEMEECTTIGAYAFASCHNLESISFPKCTTIGLSAFVYCSKLRNVTLSLCATIGDNAFSSCENLKEVHMPNVSSAGDGAFAFCRTLTTLDMPIPSELPTFFCWGCNMLSNINLSSVTSIGSRALEGVGLCSLNAPECKYLGWNALYGCSNLSEVYLPKCETLDSGAFAGCSMLRKIELPACTHISANCFQNCYLLSTVDIWGNCIISNGAFAYCSDLTKIILRAPSVVPYFYINFSVAFYVPASLVDNYRTAPSWSSISYRILPISD